MEVPDAFTPGQRVAWYRHQRGLSQADLAERIGRGRAWVSTIERGAEDLGRIPVIKQLAEILDVTPVDLDPSLGRRQDTRQPGPAAERLAKMVATVPGVVAYFAPVPQRDLPTLTQARQEVGRLGQLRRVAAYDELSADLVRLIPLLGAADHGKPHSEWTMLRTELYDLAAAALAGLGLPDAAWVAMDRGIFLTVAPRAQPEYSLSMLLRLARLHASVGRLDWAATTAGHVLIAGQRFVADGQVSHMIIAGAAHLVIAGWQAELGNTRSAAEHLADAAELADLLNGAEHNIHGFTFGAPSVALAEVIVAATTAHPDVALDKAANLDPTSLASDEGRALLAIHVALAHIAKHDFESAVAALIDAHRADPITTTTAHVARRAIVECAALRPRGNRIPRALRALLDHIHQQRS